MYIMKVIVILLCLILASCHGRQGESAPQTDTVIGHPGKEEIEENRPVSIAGVGREDPWFITVGNDTIYRYADEGPTFAPPYANASEYVEEAVKNIHIGEGISYVSFVVNKAGFPLQGRRKTMYSMPSLPGGWILPLARLYATCPTLLRRNWTGK